MQDFLYTYETEDSRTNDTTETEHREYFKKQSEVKTILVIMICISLITSVFFCILRTPTLKKSYTCIV